MKTKSYKKRVLLSYVDKKLLLEIIFNYCLKDLNIYYDLNRITNVNIIPIMKSNFCGKIIHVCRFKSYKIIVRLILI